MQKVRIYLHQQFLSLSFFRIIHHHTIIPNQPHKVNKLMQHFHSNSSHSFHVLSLKKTKKHVRLRGFTYALAYYTCNKRKLVKSIFITPYLTYKLLFIYLASEGIKFHVLLTKWCSLLKNFHHCFFFSVSHFHLQFMQSRILPS